MRKDDGSWRLASLDCIYEKDILHPVDPSQALELDRGLLGGFRKSYRFISYNLHLLGRSINADLPGDDRPDLVAALFFFPYLLAEWTPRDLVHRISVCALGWTGARREPADQNGAGGSRRPIRIQAEAVD